MWTFSQNRPKNISYNASMLVLMPSRGETLERLLREQGRTPGWLARKLELPSKQSVYDYLPNARMETPREPRDRTFWVRAAEVLGVDPAIFGIQSEQSTTPGTKPTPSNAIIEQLRGAPQINLVPYWGVVPCGDWESPSSEPELVQVSDRVVDTRNVVAVRVRGNSLAPRLLDGQLVCVKLGSEKIDGIITYVENQDRERTLKVMRRTPVGWELQSINPEYGSVTAEQVTILGHAISVEEYNPFGLSA